MIFRWYAFHFCRAFHCQNFWPWQKAWWKEKWEQKETEKEWWLRRWSAIIVLLLTQVFILSAAILALLVDVAIVKLIGL